MEDLPENSTYVLTITAVDGGGLVASQSSKVILTVIGLDVEPPLFSQSVYYFNSTEGQAAVGSVIGQVSATYSPDGNFHA